MEDDMYSARLEARRALTAEDLAGALTAQPVVDLRTSGTVGES